MLGLLSLCGKRPAANPRTVMGLAFLNPVGLAAGLDKNGEYIDALAALGFGQTVGLVTNVRGDLASSGLVRIVEVPGFGPGVTLFHCVASLCGLPCAHI
jgi:hypothetical protein